jgi:hypothetical protein
MAEKVAATVERTEEKSVGDLGLPCRAATEHQFSGKTPAARARQLANLKPPWQPGEIAHPAKPKRRRTLVEDAQAILEGGVPPNLRDMVSKRTGLPLRSVDGMTLRQAIVLYLVYDYMKRGKLDSIAQLLDRTDPKTRRVEGKMDHAHTLRGVIAGLGFGEVQAAEIYKGLLEGGTVEIEVDAV